MSSAVDTYAESLRELWEKLTVQLRNAAAKYLKCDVGLRPVFGVRQQQVRIPVHKVDADQFLAARPAKLRRTLAEGSAAPLHAGSVVLAVGELTQRQWGWGDLTQLTTGER